MSERLEPQPAYMAEPWFALLRAQVQRASGVAIAAQLGISPAALSQVLNAGGEYGRGAASTARIASRVEHTFGRYVCPHLSEEAGVEVLITAERCRAIAHVPAPTGSPRAMQHWQACHRCAHRAASAPPVPKPPRPRKPRSTQAAPSTVNEKEATDEVL